MSSPNAKHPGARFYSKAETYWSTVPPTVDGMLGGYSSVNAADIEASSLFLDEFGPVERSYALDCGCGIGRITRQLLLPRFNLVDMVDVTPAFLDQSREYIGDELHKRIGEQFCCGLQDFNPVVGRYDLIWIQWVLGHLGDASLIAFLERCAESLSGNSVIIVKENVLPVPKKSPPPDDCLEDGFQESMVQPVFDSTDSSFMRCRAALVQVFRAAGLSVVGERVQPNFPSSIYPVYMFALRPSNP